MNKKYIYHANTDPKKAEKVKLILRKVDFIAKTLLRVKEGYIIMKK